MIFALNNEYEANIRLKVNVYNSCQFPLSVNIYVYMWVNTCECMSVCAHRQINIHIYKYTYAHIEYNPLKTKWM